jgi:hypothetical protein
MKLVFLVGLLPFLGAPNVPCLLVHQITLNLIIFITHLFCFMSSLTCFSPHFSCKPQTTNHPLIPPPILTNHTPLSSSHYQPPTLHVNVGPQPYIFPNLCDHAQGPFPPSTLSAFTVTHDQTPNLPSSLQHTYNLHLKFLAPHMGVKLLVDD